MITNTIGIVSDTKTDRNADLLVDIWGKDLNGPQRRYMYEFDLKTKTLILGKQIKMKTFKLKKTNRQNEL